MVSISSEHKYIRLAFEDLIKTLKSAGSGFHSEINIEASETNIRVSMQGMMRPDREIIRIPRVALMPSDQYVVGMKGDSLYIDYFVNSTLTETQRTIIEQMFEIYNLTRKMDEHKKICFLYLMRDYPDLMAAINENRAQNQKYVQWYSVFSNPAYAEHVDQALVDTFIQTRPLGYSDPVRQDTMTTIMPVIDFLNHHWKGATFSVTNGIRKGDLTVNANQPFEENTECYAFYGVMDAMETLMRYNFVDLHAPIIRSIGVDLPIGDEEQKIKILNHSSKVDRTRNDVPSDLSDIAYYAPTIEFEKHGEDELPGDLTLSYILLAVKDSRAPLSARRILKYAVEHFFRQTNKRMLINPNDWVLEAEAKIIDENTAHYQKIIDEAEKIEKTGVDSDIIKTVKLAAETQIKRMQEYVEDMKSFDITKM